MGRTLERICRLSGASRRSTRATSWIPGPLRAAFLSADILASLPDAIVRQGCELLDAQFAGQERNVIKARLSAFVDRYLNHRFGDEELAAEPEPKPAEAAPSEPVEKDWRLAELELLELEAG
jgi:hypothetical protein